MMFNDRSSLLSFLKTRKSASAKAMGGQGPNAKEISEILEMAVRVPDHGKLAPWRFIVFDGAARGAVGEKFAAIWATAHPNHGPQILDFQRGIFERAPLVIAVVSTAAIHVKIPLWEQQLSAGVVCFNLELAAQALGFDVQWQTDWVAYDAAAKSAMGIGPQENIAGLVYIGQSTVALEDRPRPDAGQITTYWGR